jgi:membrane protein DedA with SNARE-associated domain
MNLANIAKDLLSGLGYGGLFFGLVVDSVGVPIPSEVLLPLAGALVRQGRFNLALVIIIGTLAQTIGAVAAYWIGALGGLPFVQRYGKYVMFRHHELTKTQALFERYGAWLSLVGRCLPGIRTYIGFPAGVARMRFDVFLAASILGSLIWTVLLALLGYALASKLDLIDRYMAWVGIFVLLAGIILFVWYVRGKRRH